jgi:hypothetical protein
MKSALILDQTHNICSHWRSAVNHLSFDSITLLSTLLNPHPKVPGSYQAALRGPPMKFVDNYVLEFCFVSEFVNESINVSYLRCVV